jgi:murein DD-endopeptidase MepM/ murein hydrolase activator NlpD
MKAAAAALLLTVAAAAAADYPRIARLDSRDPAFSQLQQDVEAWYRADARGDPALRPALTLYAYEPAGEDLFGLAARLSLPYDTIATANGLADPSDLEGRRFVVLPNMPGLFVPEVPATDFESILVSSTADRRSGGRSVTVAGPAGERRLLFFAGERFNPVERAFFLKILFRFPLGSRGSLSSLYGVRASPFTGHPQFHDGVDIAAAAGTPVLAAREGTVAEVGVDVVLGSFVRLAHAGGYETVYGHLQEALVSLNQEVSSGMVIGKVGTTGRTTGAHLHFEIRRKGSTRDPLPLIRIDR